MCGVGDRNNILRRQDWVGGENNEGKELGVFIDVENHVSIVLACHLEPPSPGVAPSETDRIPEVRRCVKPTGAPRSLRGLCPTAVALRAVVVRPLLGSEDSLQMMHDARRPFTKTSIEAMHTDRQGRKPANK